MFGNNVQARIVAIRNEQRAQKASSQFSYGQIVNPGNAASKSWSGRVNPDSFDVNNQVTARFLATFRRTDGVDQTPMVNFTYDYSLGKYSYQDDIDSGWKTQVSGRDKKAVDETAFSDRLCEVGTNYVKWYIDIGEGFTRYASTPDNGTDVTVTVQAIAVVKGILTLERVI